MQIVKRKRPLRFLENDFAHRVHELADVDTILPKTLGGFMVAYTVCLTQILHLAGHTEGVSPLEY